MFSRRTMYISILNTDNFLNYHITFYHRFTVFTERLTFDALHKRHDVMKLAVLGRVLIDRVTVS